MRAGFDRTALLVTLAGIILGGLLTSCRSDSQRQHPEVPGQTSWSPHPDSIFLIVEYAADHADTHALACAKGDSLTVLDVLKTITARDSLMFDTKDYPFGVLVEQIGECRNGEGGWWVYTVNTKAVPKAVSMQYLSGRDVVQFSYVNR